jgi:hypothetical protein
MSIEVPPEGLDGRETLLNRPGQPMLQVSPGGVGVVQRSLVYHSFHASHYPLDAAKRED